VGSFRFYFDDERWDWSPEVEEMHGYQPGAAAHPTTSLVLSHKHPDDYDDIAATLEDIRRTHKPFSTRHRIIDLQGRTHEVVVVGELLHDDETGHIIGTHGFYVDVTYSARDRETSITAALAKIVQGRALIEQVKGVLMVVYSIDADAAFDLLKWRSQETNLKIRQLAEQLMADFLALKYVDGPPSRSTYDQILLTVHERIAWRLE
jgi:ANTAR domain/PAS fold